MLGFFRCVAEAVVGKGVAGLVELIPGGQYVADVAADAWKRWRQKRDQQQLRAEVEQMAVATFEMAHKAAKEVAREVAASDPKLELELELYLTQIPAAVRQSLKRPDDLTGTTVPADFRVEDEDDVAKLLPPRMPRFRPGDAPAFLRGWVLEEQIGAGGFGEVWKGRNKRTPSLLGAFKFGHSLNERDFSLLNEGDVLNQVMAHGEHPGIVALRDVWNDGDDLPWLRFEYISGGDLTGVIHAWQKLPPEQRLAKVVAALRELAETVGFFHGLNPAIVHRDLKPSNILVAGDRLKVADFGIGAVSARRLLAGEAAGSMSHGARLQSYLRGSHTPLYASPEQRDPKHKPHARDDVHALGVIGFQMITGHLNRGVGSDFEEELLDFGATPELAKLLKQCVATKSDRRPKDARELAGLLDWKRLGTLVGTPPAQTSDSSAASSKQELGNESQAQSNLEKVANDAVSYQIQFQPVSYSSSAGTGYPNQILTLYLNGQKIVDNRSVHNTSYLDLDGVAPLGSHYLEAEYRFAPNRPPTVKHYTIAFDKPGHYRLIFKGLTDSSGYFRDYPDKPEVLHSPVKRKTTTDVPPG